MQRSVSSVLWRWEARVKGAFFDGQATFAGRPIITIASGSELRIGHATVINSAVRANPLACFQPSVLRTMSAGARVIIGPHVGISGAVICAVSTIEIGEGSIIGSGAMVLDNDFHSPGEGWMWADAQPESARPIHIGRGVFIGARAIILKDVTIGDRCIIGAGAVVTKDVPAGSRAVGNPARIIPANR